MLVANLYDANGNLRCAENHELTIGLADNFFRDVAP
jgi:hypothetical protein